MHEYRRDILLKYVGGLTRTALVALALGLLAGVLAIAFGLLNNPEQNAGTGIGVGLGFIFMAMWTSFTIRVAAQLLRCFVRMEEHLESISTDANLRMAKGPVGNEQRAA